MDLRDDDWARRFPAPERPWTFEYEAGHRALVAAAIADAGLCAAAAGGRLPGGYAAGYDERTVEYPWLVGQGLAGRVLDAGSTFNHEHILDRVQPHVDDLTIVTLVPEAHAHPLRHISYVYADLRELPFRDGWFDMVVSISTLEHVGMDYERYGVAGGRAGTPPADAAARAAQELVRVTRPGGRILFTVPFGAREDHGWFRQFDPADLEELVAAFALAEPPQISVFRYDREGWSGCAPEAASDRRYRDYLADPTPVPDRAVAARGVACVALRV